MIECTEGLKLACQHGVDQAVIEIKPLLIDGVRSVRKDPRPVRGKAIALHIGISNEIQIFLIP